LQCTAGQAIHKHLVVGLPRAPSTETAAPVFPQVHDVWEYIAQRIPERARWIDELKAHLEAAETKRVKTVEAALVAMVRGGCIQGANRW
jgi:hypothetical protein